MNRRGFLQSILVAAAAPAIVRADSLMRIVSMETEILTSFSQDIVIDQEGFTGLRDGRQYINGHPYGISEIIAATFVKHREQIEQNIRQRNGLLLQVLKRQHAR